MKLTGLQALVAIVDLGSIHAAARRLNVSQPALSKTLRALEEELGVQLVTRTSRGTIATQFGRAFYRRAQMVVTEVEKATQEVQQMRGNLAGDLAVSVAPAAAMRLFPDAMNSFRADFPAIAVQVLEGLHPVATEQLRSNIIEIAIMPLPERLSPHEFRVEKLISIEMAIVARVGHPLADATSIAELCQADWLHIGVGNSFSRVLTELFESRGLSVPRAAVSCPSAGGALAILGSNDLIAMLPKQYVSAPHLRTEFVQLQLTEPATINDIFLVFRADRPLTPAALALATHIRRVAKALTLAYEPDQAH